MCSRQDVAQGATGCSAKGKTIAKLLAVVFSYTIFLLSVIRGEAKDLLWLKLTAARE